MGFPFMGDHGMICGRLRESGAGLYFEGKDFTPSKIHNLQPILQKIWTDKRFFEKAQILREVMKNAGGTKKAADLAEWRIKWGNKPMDFMLPHYEESIVKFYSWDVLGFLALMMFGAWVSFRFVRTATGRMTKKKVE